MLKPEYNILTKAYSSLGYKHNEDSLAKIKKAALGRIVSDETRKRMRQAALARIDLKTRKISAEWRAKIAAKLGKEVIVTNINTNETFKYVSLRDAAKALNSNESTIRRYILKNKPFQNLYYITYA